MMRGALIGVTVSAVLVLSLMLLLWMNDRRQEMGILVSLGVGKPSLVAQYLAEDEDLGAGGWRAPGHAPAGPPAGLRSGHAGQRAGHHRFLIVRGIPGRPIPPGELREPHPDCWTGVIQIR